MRCRSKDPPKFISGPLAPAEAEWKKLGSRSVGRAHWTDGCKQGQASQGTAVDILQLAMGKSDGDDGMDGVADRLAGRER